MKIYRRILSIVLVIGCFLNNYHFVQAANYSGDIVGQVEKYTSMVNKEEINNCIENGEYQKAKNLIQEAKEGYQERWGFEGLITNDMYIAYQFKDYVTEDICSEGWWANATTWLSGLFYNGELEEYLSLQSPGKNKYKDMLKQFISDSREELVCIEYAKDLMTAIESADELADYFEKDTYDILYQMFSEAGSKEEIDEAVMQFLDTNADFFANEGRIYVYKNNLSDSFDMIGTGLDYLDTTVSMIMDIQYICANKDVLDYYADLLENIQCTKDSNGEYIAPEDLREAARELQRELEGDISSIIKTAIEKYGYTAATTGVDILSFISNGF